jgi:hypothetical protein
MIFSARNNQDIRQISFFGTYKAVQRRAAFIFAQKRRKRCDSSRFPKGVQICAPFTAARHHRKHGAREINQIGLFHPAIRRYGRGMTTRHFANTGQVLQLGVAVVGTVISGINAFPSIAASDYVKSVVVSLSFSLNFIDANFIKVDHINEHSREVDVTIMRCHGLG